MAARKPCSIIMVRIVMRSERRVNVDRWIPCGLWPWLLADQRHPRYSLGPEVIQMKIATVESLHADAGSRNFDFLKVTTDTGLVGWSEYNEAFGGPGLSAVIDRLAPAVIGKDPRAWEAHVAHMYAVRRQSSGGVIQQAIAAIENAMLDVKARALGIPVYEMLGGPVRDRIRLYWSHCGTYRVRAYKEMQIPPVKTLDDIVERLHRRDLHLLVGADAIRAAVRPVEADAVAHGAAQHLVHGDAERARLDVEHRVLDGGDGLLDHAPGRLAPDGVHVRDVRLPGARVLADDGGRQPVDDRR